MWVDLAPLAHEVRYPYRRIEVVGRLPLGIELPSEDAQASAGTPHLGKNTSTDLLKFTADSSSIHYQFIAVCCY